MAELALTPAPATPAGAQAEAPDGSRPAPPRRRERPGGSSLALRTVAMLYVGVLVLLPLALLFYRTFETGLTRFFTAISAPDAVHAFQVTAIITAISVVIDTVFGVAVAILLVRYRFPGRRLLSAFIDLPVAVSPIVVGLALVLVYGPQGWWGPTLQDNGLMIIGAKPGMVLATVFVSLPLVVRAVAPVLEQSGMDQELAASSLGANAYTRFVRITLPTIRTALAYGVVLTIARCVGEYGAVLVVSQNVIGSTETAPLRIGNLVENDQDLPSAYAIAFVLVVVALVAIAVGALIRRRKRI